MTIALFLCVAFARGKLQIGALVPLACMACDLTIAYWALT